MRFLRSTGSVPPRIVRTISRIADLSLHARFAVMVVRIPSARDGGADAQGLLSYLMHFVVDGEAQSAAVFFLVDPLPPSAAEGERARATLILGGPRRRWRA